MVSCVFCNVFNFGIVIRNDGFEVGEFNIVISVIGVSRFGVIFDLKGVVVRKFVNRVIVINVFVD